MPGDLRRIIPLDIGLNFADRQVYGRSARLHGFAVAEATGAAVASFVLRNGSSIAGVAAIPVNLAASESVREWFGETGITFDDGVFLDAGVGAIVGTIWLSELASDVFAETDIGAAFRSVE